MLISKNSKMSETKTFLNDNGIPLSHGWQLILGMLLQDCDYIKLEGYGRNANLVKITMDIEELKSSIISHGEKAIADFLGYNPKTTDNKELHAAMDEAICQMPNEELFKFNEKYVNP